MNLHIHIPAASNLDSDPTFPMPETYDYWPLVAAHYLKQSSSIEIHCWNEEKQVIAELKESDHFIMKTEEKMTIFKGNKTGEGAEYLLRRFKGNDGKFKWFSVFFDGFSSEHWATELIVENADNEELAFIKSVTPANTNIHPY